MKRLHTAFITKHTSALMIVCFALICSFALLVTAQTEVTGAFEGQVVDSRTNAPIKDAVVRMTETQTGVVRSRRTDDKGKFRQGLLQPGIYKISISAPGYKTRETTQRLVAVQVTKVMPYPTALEPEAAAQP